MKSTKIGFLLVAVVLMQVFAASAQMYETDYNATGTNTPNDPHFAVTVLKYEPYPVNAGSWFNVWIKVQNIGQSDAKNARFVLQPSYPFSSEDSLVRDYGIVPGVTTAYQMNMQGNANEVVLEYRVKVADNAPVGTSTLQFAAVPDLNSPQDNSVTRLLPIEIGQTKTDFDAVMQDSTAQGTSFTIANIGQNAATAVTVTLEQDATVSVTGASSSIIGNLAQGDFTTVNFQLLPNRNLQQVKLQIAYTDIAGVRNTVEKIVPVNVNSAFTRPAASGATASGYRNSSASNYRYLYLLAGMGLGGLVFVGYRAYAKYKKKKIAAQK